MKNKKIFLFFCFFFVLLTFAIPVFALEIIYPNLPPPFDAISPNTFSRTSPQEALPLFIKYIYSLIMWLGTAAAFIIFVWGGVLFLTAGAKPDQLASGKEKMSAAFFGFLILLSSYLILKTINPNLVWLDMPKLKKVELPDFSVIEPPVSEEYNSSIQVELPFGAIIERLFNKSKKYQDYTEEEKKLFEEEFKKGKDKHFTKLVLGVSENSIKIAEELLKNAKELKQLSEECSCQNAKARCDVDCKAIPNNPLKIPNEADSDTISIIQKYNSGSSCSGDPCQEETRKKIIALQEKNKKLIDEKFKKELLKQKTLSFIIRKELEKMQVVEEFIKKCPASMLLSLRNLGTFIDELKKNDWYVGSQREERYFVWDFEIWKDLQKPENQKIFESKDPASFYCPVSGNLMEKNFEPGSTKEEEELEKSLESDEEPASISGEYTCSQEIPVGEIIDRAKRLASRLIERIEKMFDLGQQLIKEVDNLQVLISQCSSQAPRCKSDCSVVADVCVQKCIVNEEGPCPKSKIEETIKKIEDLIEIKEEGKEEKEGLKNVFDTPLEESSSAQPANGAKEGEKKEQKVGIKQIVEEIGPKLLDELHRKIRVNMQECVKTAAGEPQLTSCGEAKNLKGEYGYIEACCVPQKTAQVESSEKKEDSFEKCLNKCYLTAGFNNEKKKEGNKYKKCLADCLDKEAKERKAPELKKCNHFINFYCCR